MVSISGKKRPAAGLSPSVKGSLYIRDRCKAVRFTDEKCKCDGWL